MAWQEVAVTFVEKKKSSEPQARLRSSPSGGLTLTVNRLLCTELGWTDGQRCTLLVGGGEAEGKIAIRPKPSGPISVVVYKSDKKSAHLKARAGGAIVVCGHFGQLVPGSRKVTVVPYEAKHGNLALTMPEGWLVSAT